MPHPISRREFLKYLALATGSAVLSACQGRRPSTDDVAPLTILHYNDLHGALLPKSEGGGERGGAANLVGLIERKRAEAAGPVLLLDAGDALQGTYISNRNHGEAVVEIMNLSGVDALALGNHAFDWGLDVLRERVAQARFPCLAANLEMDPGVSLEGVEPYAVVERDGLALGILGLTYHDLTTIVKASAIEGVRSIPAEEAVRRYLPELQAKADLVIVLSHLGLDGDRALAEAMPELSLIVGGHSHRPLQSGDRVGDTLIVQAGAYGEYLGHVEAAYDRGSGRILASASTARLVRVTHAGTASEEAAAVVARWAAEAEQMGDQVVGETAIPLRRGRGEETALGNLITDAMRAADLGDGRTADVAVHNDGGIRADLQAGPITYADMYAVLPFDNSLVGLDLTGEQVRELLENGMDDQGSGLQVSGLAYSYSMNKSRGRRVVSVTVGAAPLDPERTYRVVTLDYLHTHPSFRLSLGLGQGVTYGGLCLDAVIDHVRAHSPVSPQVEGRITQL